MQYIKDILENAEFTEFNLSCIFNIANLVIGNSDYRTSEVDDGYEKEEIRGSMMALNNRLKVPKDIMTRSFDIVDTIIKVKPFPDCNQLIAFYSALLFLSIHGCDITLDPMFESLLAYDRASDEIAIMSIEMYIQPRYQTVAS